MKMAHVQAGALFLAKLESFVARRWFLTVTSSTKFISVSFAIGFFIKYQRDKKYVSVDKDNKVLF